MVDVSGYNNSASIKILVGMSDLVAAIDGGDRNNAIGSTLALDASPSFDPDSPETSNGLLFAWHCAVLVGTGTCPSNMDAVSSIETVLDTVGEYEFQVTLTKFFKGGQRNISTSISIEAINGIPPPVSIAALAIAKVNPSEKLILTGTSGPAVGPFDLEWSLSLGDLSSGSLVDRATTSLTDLVAADISDTNYLVLPPHSLTAGAIYEFTLTASYLEDANAVSGYSVLTILVNAPPSSGRLAVSPDEGFVLQTPYLFKASGWVDDLLDLPLLYSFYYIIYGTSVEYQIVSNTPASSRDGTLLPRGGGNSSQIVGVSYVTDQLGAATRSTAVVVCESISITVSDLANITGQLLAASLESGDVEGIYGVLIASSSLLNSVNCTVPCGSLGRETCSVDGLCGQCAIEYVGLVGPSNTPCYVETGNCNNGIVDSDEADVDCGGHECAPCQSGSTCLFDADCYHGQCSSGVCVTPPKQCNNNCSSHGSCSRWDTTGAQLRADECAADDWWCTTLCSCSTGWYGESCSYDEITYAEVIALRNIMLGSLGDASGMQDVTSSALNQQASSLSSLAADPSQLSGGGELLTLDLIGSIAGGSAQAGLSGGTADCIGDTVSNLLSSSLLSSNVSTHMPTTAPTVHITSALRRRLMEESPTAAQSTAVAVSDSAAITAINDAIGSLSSAQLGNAVAGEAAATITTANVMMASSRAFASDAAKSPSSPPPNAGGAAPVVSLGVSVAVIYDDGESEVASDTPVDTQVQQWGYNIYADSADTATISSLVTLSVSTNEGGRRRRLKLMERRSPIEGGERGAEPLVIVLQNVKPVDYSLSSANEYVDLVCEEGFIGDANATCPGTNATTKVVCDGRYPITQNGIITGFATNWSTRVSCSVTAVPSCLLWDSLLQSYDSTSCFPKNWTSTNTTCVCGAQASKIVTRSGASFTSGSAALLGYFASTFDASSFRANMFAQNPELLVTFGVMLIVLIINILLGIKYDQSDNAAEWTVLESKKTRFESGRLDLEPLRVSAGVADSAETRKAVQDQHTTAAFASASLPQFVTDSSTIGTITRVIAEEHTWIAASAWGAYDPNMPRHIKSQTLAIEILWVMVSQAVYRQFTNPDLGCSLHTTEDDCLVTDAAWPAKGGACVWDTTLEEPCYTAPADTSERFSLLNMLLIVLVSMVTKPFVVLVQWTYQLIFNAATARPRSKAMMALASEQQQWVWSVLTAPGQEMEGTVEGRNEAESNAGQGSKKKFKLTAVTTVGHQFGAPPSAEGNADEEDFPGLAMHKVIAPASRLGLEFSMCDLTKFARVAHIDSSSPLIGKVRLGDMLVQIDDDAPTRKLETASRVEAVLLARERCTRVLYFVADHDRLKETIHLPLRVASDLDDVSFDDAETMLRGGGAPPTAENSNDTEGRPLQTHSASPAATELVTVVIPPGPAGLLLGVLDDGVRTAVIEIATTSALAGLVLEGDVVQTLDGADVSRLPPAQIAKLVVSKTHQQRLLVIERPGGGGGVKQNAPPPSDACGDGAATAGAGDANDGAVNWRREKSIVTSVTTGQLPSWKQKNEFNAYVTMITARQCVGVMARQEELVEALTVLEERANAPDVSPEELKERDAVAKLLTDFRKRWKLEQRSEQRGGLCGCMVGRGSETAEEKLHRVVLSKVKNDVKQAIKWDEELSSMSAQGKEKHFLELARFELLSFPEKKVYLKNGGCATDPDLPAPVWLITKLAAAIVIIVLTLFPAMYLLLFGVQQGREVTRLWLIGFLLCLALELVVTEPLKICIMFGLLPSLVRRKIKQLADPTRGSTFPFKTVLFEHPTTYLAHKHPGLLVAQSALVHRAALADLGEEQPALTTMRHRSVRHHRASVNTRAQLFLLFWATVLILPEDIQVCILGSGWDLCVSVTVRSTTLLRVAGLACRERRDVRCHHPSSTSNFHRGDCTSF